MWLIIRGGLGNQLFQLAYALRIEQQLGRRPSLLDATARARVGRTWTLDAVGVPALSLGSLKERALLTEMSVRLAAQQRTSRWMGVLTEDRASPEGPPPADVRFVTGYWQGWRWMQHVIGEARAAFQFPPLAHHRQIKRRGRPVVSLHIRRGDYLSDPVARQFHHVCDAHWYRNAIATARQRLGDVDVLLFSDDPEGALSDLGTDGAGISIAQRHDDDPDWMDLAAMSQCDHHILSNSSFSWWGAMIRKDLAKLVIAPAHWYPGKRTSDLKINPPEWTLM